MPGQSSSPTPATPAATFVVVLFFDGEYRGMAGPLSSADQAKACAEKVVGDDPGWTWEVEPVVPPEALPTAEERGVLPRPRLRLVT